MLDKQRVLLRQTLGQGIDLTCLYQASTVMEYKLSLQSAKSLLRIHFSLHLRYCLIQQTIALGISNENCLRLRGMVSFWMAVYVPLSTRDPQQQFIELYAQSMSVRLPSHECPRCAHASSHLRLLDLMH